MYGPLQILILLFYGPELWARVGRDLALTEILPPTIRGLQPFF